MSSEEKKDAGKESAEESTGATGDTEEEPPSADFLQRLLARLGISKPGDKETKQEPEYEQILDEVTFEGIAKYIKTKKCKRIVTMAGAGISTAAGIPDFRSPGSGLYDNLQQYNLPYPEAIFEIRFFLSNPEPFFKLAKELYPGNFKPTTSHYFLRLLHEKGLLLRHYTQNIDTLERIAGVPGDKLVEAHGTFYTAHCLDCNKMYSQDWIKNEIFADKIPTCEKETCEGVVKPDIVFFGENLPDRFSSCVLEDMEKCDLLIIMGTSLAVQPFASLVDRVSETTPRLLINREKCGQQTGEYFMLFGSGGLRFDDPKNYRDVAWLGSCDDGCLALAELLGWKNELVKMVEEEHKKIDNTSGKNKKEEEKLSQVKDGVETQGNDGKVDDVKQSEQAECDKMVDETMIAKDLNIDDDKKSEENT